MEAMIEQSIEVAATQARLWQLVSTSEGLSSWFVSAHVVAGSSGSVTLRFGPDAEGTMPIRCWEPPRRIRFGAAPGEIGRAHDFEVTDAPGGGGRVRVVDSGLEETGIDVVRETWALYLSRLKTQAENG